MQAYGCSPPTAVHLCQCEPRRCRACTALTALGHRDGPERLKFYFSPQAAFSQNIGSPGDTTAGSDLDLSDQAHDTGEGEWGPRLPWADGACEAVRGKDGLWGCGAGGGGHRGERKETTRVAQAALSPLCLRRAVLQAGWVQLGVSACLPLWLLMGVTWPSGQRLVLSRELPSSTMLCLTARPAASQVRRPGAWGGRLPQPALPAENTGRGK